MYVNHGVHNNFFNEWLPASYSKVRDMPFVPCSGKHRSSPIVDTADTFSAKKETFKFCYLTRLNMRKAARLTEGMND